MTVESLGQVQEPSKGAANKGVHVSFDHEQVSDGLKKGQSVCRIDELISRLICEVEIFEEGDSGAVCVELKHWEALVSYAPFISGLRLFVQELLENKDTGLLEREEYGEALDLAITLLNNSSNSIQFGLCCERVIALSPEKREERVVKLSVGLGDRDVSLLRKLCAFSEIIGF